MDAFQEYIGSNIHRLLKKRRVVVFYDPQEAFHSFIEALPRENEGPLPQVTINGRTAHLAVYEGSFFDLRRRVEPVAGKDQPDPLLVYVPGEERDREGSLLMELEKGGETYEPQLRRLARHALRETYTDGQIDTFLASDAITYEDVADLLRQAEETEQASLLRTLYDGRKGIDLLARWISTPEDDERVRSKGAEAELRQLIETRLGLPLEGEALGAVREKTLRYVLLDEFRGDLNTEPPSSLDLVPRAPAKDERRRVRKLADKLRQEFPPFYAEAATNVEQQFQLSQAGLNAAALGSIDTFRFEADVILEHAGALVADEAYAEALKLVETHRGSYWVQRDVSREAQWEAVRLMAALGDRLEAVRASMQKTAKDAACWVEAYTTEDGWYRIDSLHRALEDWVANMGEDPQAEQALGKVRRAYERLLHEMAEGFSNVLAGGGWVIEDAFQQTQVYPEVVEAGAGPTAFFLVDALRYEMGVELGRKLERAEELQVRPAIAALPTVTAVGMAALLPDASSSFTVVEHDGKLAAQIEDTPLTDLKARLAFLRQRVPDVVDLKLQDAISLSRKRLEKRIEGGSLVLVRSQEIDALGEGGFSHLARQVMSEMVSNVARVVRKLADAGISSFAVAADHGHQFALRKGKDMRLDAPGGDTVKLTRRCWAGRGGKTPSGAVRVQGALLGYDTDLDFIFPRGAAVLSSQGDLSYHHGGTSLQELVVPVLNFRLETAEEEQPVGIEVALGDVPEAITNRTFRVKLLVRGDLFNTDPIPLSVIVLAGDEQVGEARMASTNMDSERGWIEAQPGDEIMAGLILTREDLDRVRIAVQDPQSGSLLAQSDDIPVSLSI